ncbi:aminoglycoside phosphotransferase family protein [Peribacillus sp. SCS-37]|uniref:aminoglycoside phosphotransferase family protein n=1 Tax=Paraperibacillus esterisolvens TaxID=3115296 RepID=UPI0039064C29
MDTAGGGIFLLKTAALSELGRKESESAVLKELHTYGAACPKAVETGTIPKLGLCYQVVTYIEGDEARDVLPDLPDELQRQAGFDAGRDLWRLHQLSAPHGIAPWYKRAAAKHARYADAYKTCGIKIKEDERVLRYIEDNLTYLKTRPDCFQHDDFHPANLVMKDGRYAGAIDFNRYDWGDPVHDFYKTALFSTEVSVPFSVGQVQGYFGGAAAPAEFWKLYAIYAAMGIFSGVVWTLRAMPQSIEEMKARAERILEEHKYFEAEKPIWFPADE